MLLKHGLAGLAKVPDAGGLTKTFLDAATDSVSLATAVPLDFTSAVSGKMIYLAVPKVIGTQSNGISTVSVEGDPATLVGASSSTIARTKVYIYKIACPAAAAGNASASITATGTGGEWAPGAWMVEGTISTETVTTNQYTDGTSPLVGSVNTVTGGVLLGLGVQEDLVTGLTWTGATEDAEIDADTATKRIEWVSADISSGETPRTVTAAHTGAGGTDHGAIITVALS